MDLVIGINSVVLAFIVGIRIGLWRGRVLMRQVLREHELRELDNARRVLLFNRRARVQEDA